MNWTKAVKVEDLQKKKAMVFRSGAKQIALLQHEGRTFALDNRCPHEGYPLSQGSVDESCILTCQWHNWKFDLSNGENVLGGDNVRTYATREEEGYIWVDLSPLSPEVVLRQILKALRKALHERDYGRLARELVRLHFHKLDPTRALVFAIEWSASQLEFGTTHAYAGMADWLALYDEHPEDPELQLTALTEALDHIAFDVIRHEEFPYAEESLPYTSQALADAIEQEDESRAASLVRGALATGLGFEDLERTLTSAALKHYNDFGHSLIYVVKTGYLIRRLGQAVEAPLLLSLVRHLCYTTREDLIPDFASYAPSLEAFPEFGPASNTTRSTDKPNLPPIPKKSIKQALKWVVEQASETSPEALYVHLTKANAANMLNFDRSKERLIHQHPKDNTGWLDFTHALTFANAVRVQSAKFPEFWKPGLLQIACFFGRNLPHLGTETEADAWQVSNPEEFWNETIAHLFDHGLGLPIFAVHHVKTSLAVREEVQHEPDLEPHLLAALNRFLHSPLKQKHPRRAVSQGMDLVGKDF